ncbi:hypothetical protein F2P81_020266 [Scophthalmus maximus]|uniref:Uncharacterized protein n=1 Tax=Scophthalmus maximus TaxID=52904 RepID=A0A6A4S5H3_SCOMX|nr:hypothetical protein F2P81_020266 [Scophthalmus maximus]
MSGKALLLANRRKTGTGGQRYVKRFLCFSFRKHCITAGPMQVELIELDAAVTPLLVRFAQTVRADTWAAAKAFRRLRATSLELQDGNKGLLSVTIKVNFILDALRYRVVLCRV